MCTLETRGNFFILTLTGSTDHRLSPSIMTTLESHLAQIRSESKPGSILITTARGSNFFSNGFDLAWAESDGPANYPTRLRQLGLQFKSLLSSLFSLPLPTIAAVTGHASAAGCMFAVSHDYVLMRRDRGFLYMSEVDLGMTFSDYMMTLMKLKFGKGLRDMVLAGTKVKADEAVKMGVVDQAYDTAEETIEAALRLGEKLAPRKWNGEIYAEIRKSTMKELLPQLGLVEKSIVAPRL